VKIVASLPPIESWQILLVKSIHKLLMGSLQEEGNPEQHPLLRFVFVLSFVCYVCRSCASSPCTG